MVQSSTGFKPDQSDMYTRVLKAAEACNDSEMLFRRHGVHNGDLVAVKARYHRSKNCYTKYISQHGINTEPGHRESNDSYRCAVIQLITEFQPLIIDDKKVFFLITIRDRFSELLKESGVEHPEGYQSKKVKKLLIKEWPDVSFIPQPGMSDLVCSKNISVGEVLRKASDLMKMLNELSKCEDEQRFGNLTENALLHEAASVLRRRISVSKTLEGEYHSSEEMSSLKLKDWVDPVLYKFICWVTDKNLFDNGAEVSDLKPNLPALNIACDIISQSTSVISPEHLGLAVYLHHEFGSRKLVDSLHAMSYCISYTELRRFLTSAAEHINASQEPTSTGTYKPPEITSRNEGGHLIVAVADN